MPINSEKLLGEVGNGNGDQGTHHPLDERHVAFDTFK